MSRRSRIIFDAVRISYHCQRSRSGTCPFPSAVMAVCKKQSEIDSDARFGNQSLPPGAPPLISDGIMHGPFKIPGEDAHGVEHRKRTSNIELLTLNVEVKRKNSLRQKKRKCDGHRPPLQGMRNLATIIDRRYSWKAYRRFTVSHRRDSRSANPWILRRWLPLRWWAWR